MFTLMLKNTDRICCCVLLKSSFMTQVKDLCMSAVLATKHTLYKMCKGSLDCDQVHINNYWKSVWLVICQRTMLNGSVWHVNLTFIKTWCQNCLWRTKWDFLKNQKNPACFHLKKHSSHPWVLSWHFMHYLCVVCGCMARSQSWEMLSMFQMICHQQFKAFHNCWMTWELFQWNWRGGCAIQRVCFQKMSGPLKLLLHWDTSCRTVQCTHNSTSRCQTTGCSMLPRANIQITSLSRDTCHQMRLKVMDKQHRMNNHEMLTRIQLTLRMMNLNSLWWQSRGTWIQCSLNTCH